MRSRRSQWGGLTELQLLWLQELESASEFEDTSELGYSWLVCFLEAWPVGILWPHRQWMSEFGQSAALSLEMLVK